MMDTFSRIAGTGSYLPERRVTNAELAKTVDTNDEWIVSRTGIRERHYAADHQDARPRTRFQLRRNAAPAIGDIVTRARGNNWINAFGQLNEHMISKGHMNEVRQRAAKIHARSWQAVSRAKWIGFA